MQEVYNFIVITSTGMMSYPNALPVLAFARALHIYISVKWISLNLALYALKGVGLEVFTMYL